MKLFRISGLVIFLFLMWANVYAQTDGKLKLGDTLPSFMLESATYGQINTEELDNKVVMISLFATWCGPCQKELAEIEKTIYPVYGKRSDFCLLVIGREHTDAELKEYNGHKHFSFPLYPDPERKVYSLFADQTIPRTYLFDKEGKLVYVSKGYTPEEFQKLVGSVKEALK